MEGKKGGFLAVFLICLLFINNHTISTSYILLLKKYILISTDNAFVSILRRVQQEGRNRKR